MGATSIGAPRRSSPSALKEHGFWVMLGASLAGALARAGANQVAWLAALVVATAFVLGAMETYPLVRRSVVLQLVAASSLACAGVPVAALAHVATRSITAAALANGAVFVGSVLLARGALAAAGKNGARKSTAFGVAASGLPLAVAFGLGVAGQLAQALGCLFAAVALAVLASLRPTAKDLKPLGLRLGVVVVLATVGPVLA